MTNLWNNEPAMIVTAVQAILVLATSFGLHLSAEQIGAMITLTTVISGLVIRSKVTPVSK